MKKNFKSLLIASIMGVSSMFPLITPITSYANTKSVDESSSKENTVIENKVSEEEFNNFGSDSDYQLYISDDVLNKMKNGEPIKVRNVHNPSLYASVQYNWRVGNKYWSIKYNGLNPSIYSEHVTVTNKFRRNGGTYTGTLHNDKHYGFTSSVSADGKVGPKAGTIQKGDTIYLKVVQGGKTLYNSGYGN